MLSHRERMENCLAGEKPDRVPIALWRHFPVDDQSPETLANATINFQHTFDLDVIKVSPSSSFCLRDWGAKDEWLGAPEGTREYSDPLITNPEDWEKLTILDPDKGSLGKQISCLRILFNEFGPATPIIQTIFNPLSQAKNLIGKENLVPFLRMNPDALHAGLKIITDTTIKFIEEIKLTGISGIFFAVQHAQHNLLTKSEYEEFGKSYDLAILQAAEDMWLKMLHIHGKDIMFDLFQDYPVNIINWHDKETDPSLSEAKEIWDGVVCGGLNRISTMVLGTPQAAIADAQNAIDQTGGIRFLLGTGCVLPVTTPFGIILSVRNFVDNFRIT
ncbi:MAG: uroporphyrinogen decarboxylase family protein [Anaerolineales bacterium]|jgi:uroporphyrinogen decarboxylase